MPLRRLLCRALLLLTVLAIANAAFADNWYEHLMTSGDVSQDSPSGWEQTGQLIGALALIAAGLIALVIGGPIGIAIGVALTVGMAYNSYRQGGWAQVNKDFNPFVDFWEAVLDPNLSGKERLWKFTTAGLKALGLAGIGSGIRRGLSSINNFRRAAQAEQAASRALLASGARRAGQAQQQAAKVAKEAKDVYRGLYPDARMRALARQRANTVRNWNQKAREAAETRLQNRYGWGDVHFERGPMRPSATPMQIDPNGCWAAGIRSMRKQLGLPDIPEHQLMAQAKQMGILHPDGAASVTNYVKLMRNNGMDAVVMQTGSLDDIARVLQGGKGTAVSTSIRSGTSSTFHRVQIQEIKVIGNQRYVKVGDPGFPEPYLVPFDDFAKVMNTDRVLIAQRAIP